MRTEVDVLTLTATPIPRTLHMSLTGVRDLSTIDTPPEERLPIKTFVGDFDETLVRQAILREMDRNGQVYFVHNRVQGIEQMAARVQQDRARGAHRHRPRPDAGEGAVRGHAGLRRGRVRRAGLHHHHRERAGHPERQHDHHQPGGHVRPGAALPAARPRGRSAVRAYAYLLVDKYKTLTEDARRRLEAIQEASDLGAGFRIAMHDLEIRGAGELLGARQHGHIAAVGLRPVHPPAGPGRPGGARAHGAGGQDRRTTTGRRPRHRRQAAATCWRTRSRPP